MATQRAVKITDNDDEYFGDVFSDERILLEEIDPDDSFMGAPSANQDLWDMLEITDEDWRALSE